MIDQPQIKLPDPRRTWLLHCTDAWGDLGVCTITVEKGTIAIYAPKDTSSFELDHANIAEFHAAFNAALDLAESDLRAKAVIRPQP